MASTKRLLKERAKIAREPIPYVTFHDEDDMSDDAAPSGGINEWRFILSVDPAHDSIDEAAEIGKAADSPYCHPPAGSSGSKKLGGLLSGVTRAAKSSKKNSNDMAAGASSSSSSSSSSGGGPAYFAFQLDFPPNYPFKPPTITFLSQSYHPNIKKDTGALCDAVLTGEEWGPTLNVRKICARLRKFLCEPDPDHPLESDLAQLLVESPGEYNAAAFKYAQEFGTRGKAEEAMARGKQKK